MKVGSVLKLLRVKLNLSQKEMAAKLKISQNYLSMLESDKREPSSDKIAQFAAELGVSKDALLLACSDIPAELSEKDKKSFLKLQSKLIAILLIEVTDELGEMQESA